jgi:hypothetical protein
MRSKEKLQPLAISRAGFSCSPSTLRREYPSRKTELRESVPSRADPEMAIKRPNIGDMDLCIFGPQSRLYLPAYTLRWTPTLCGCLWTTKAVLQVFEAQQKDGPSHRAMTLKVRTFSPA